MSADCSDVNNIDEYNVNFVHKLIIDNKKDIDCKISYFEVSPMKKVLK